MRIYLMLLELVNLCAYHTVGRRADWRYALVEYKFRLRRRVENNYKTKPVTEGDDIPF